MCTYLHSKHCQSRVPFLCKVMLSLQSLVLWTHPTTHTTLSLLSCVTYTNSYHFWIVWVLPSSNTGFLNIPLPLRRERIISHFQFLEIICCLHQSESGSTFLFIANLRRSSIHFMLRTVSLLTLTLLTGRQAVTHFINAMLYLPLHHATLLLQMGICYMAFWFYHVRTFTC